MTNAAKTKIADFARTVSEMEVTLALPTETHWNSFKDDEVDQLIAWTESRTNGAPAELTLEGEYTYPTTVQL